MEAKTVSQAPGSAVISVRVMLCVSSASGWTIVISEFLTMGTRCCPYVFCFEEGVEGWGWKEDHEDSLWHTNYSQQRNASELFMGP